MLRHESLPTHTMNIIASKTAFAHLLPVNYRSLEEQKYNAFNLFHQIHFVPSAASHAVRDAAN